MCTRRRRRGAVWRQFNFTPAADLRGVHATRRGCGVTAARPSCVTSAGRFRGRAAPIARPSCDRNVRGTHADEARAHTVVPRDFRTPSARAHHVVGGGGSACASFAPRTSHPPKIEISITTTTSTTIMICASTHAAMTPPRRSYCVHRKTVRGAPLKGPVTNECSTNARAAQIIFTRDTRVTGSHDSFSILFLNLWLDFVALFIFFLLKNHRKLHRI